MGVTGFYNIIVNLIQLCALFVTNTVIASKNVIQVRALDLRTEKIK